MADNDRPRRPTPALTGKHPAPKASAAYQEASRLTGFAPVVKGGNPAQNQTSSAGSRPSRGRKSRHHRPEGDIIGPNDEIIFEFSKRGEFVQVYAMHGPTLTEVAVMGPAQATSRELEQLALSKLRFVMKKQLEER